MDETDHLQQVLTHPAYVADPFAALQQHLDNTVTSRHHEDASGGGGTSTGKKSKNADRSKSRR